MLTTVKDDERTHFSKKGQNSWDRISRVDKESQCRGERTGNESWISQRRQVQENDIAVELAC